MLFVDKMGSLAVFTGLEMREHMSSNQTTAPKRSKVQTRVDRVIRMICLVNEDRYDNPEDLAHALGISRRTLFRDIATLREAGVTCYIDTRYGYVMRLPKRSRTTQRPYPQSKNRVLPPTP